MSLILGGSGGGSGNVTSDPKKLSIEPIRGASFITSPTVAANADADTASTAILALNRGNFVDVTAVNTWFTLCDIVSSRGVIGNIISPACGNSSNIDYEITVDGTTTIISALTDSSSYGRNIVGVAIDSYYNADYRQYGFSVSIYASITRAHKNIERGIVLGFNDSIKIRVRCAVLPNSYQGRKRAYVTHTIY